MVEDSSKKIKSINDLITPAEVFVTIISEAQKRRGNLSDESLQAMDGLKKWADLAMLASEDNREAAVACLQMLAYIEIALQIKATTWEAPKEEHE